MTVKSEGEKRYVVKLYEEHYYLWYCPHCGKKNRATIKTKIGNTLPKCYHCQSIAIATDKVKIAEEIKNSPKPWSECSGDDCGHSSHTPGKILKHETKHWLD